MMFVVVAALLMVGVGAEELDVGILSDSSSLVQQTFAKSAVSLAKYSCCPHPDYYSCPHTDTPLNYVSLFGGKRCCKVLSCPWKVTYAKCDCPTCKYGRGTGRCRQTDYKAVWAHLQCRGHSGSFTSVLYKPQWYKIRLPTRCTCGCAFGWSCLQVVKNVTLVKG